MASNASSSCSPTCVLCGYFAPSLKLLVSHLRIVHSKDPSFNIVCGITGCKQVYRAFAAYNTHVYRHHRVELELEKSNAVEPSMPSCTTVDVFNFTDEHDSFVNTTTLTPSPTYPVPTSSQALKNQTAIAAKFILHLREGRRVSQVAVNDVIDMCNEMCANEVKELKQEIRDTLLKANGYTESVADILDRSTPHLFDGVKSTYLFEKFCVEHLGCLEPEEICYDKPRWVNQLSGYKRRKVMKTDKFYYVPLLDSLKSILNLEDFQAEILNPHQSQTDQQLLDFCDGSTFKSHPIFSSHQCALQIIAYYDELEVVNPIGSYVKKHKLGCMFYFLANIRPQYRSTLKTIQLVAVGKYEDISTHGIDAFMRPFVEDIKRLYCDGINITIGGVDHVFHGGLLAFLADNLAAHLVGGFKQSMSFALRICRSCMITRDLSQECFIERDCVLRTEENHFKQCALLRGPMADHYSTSYGINRLSILEEIPGFSVVNGLPHDIMHDLFEGVVPYHMTYLLQYCVAERFFTIQELNEKINSFDFLDSKPTPIDPIICRTETKVRQSASQMITLLREFPMIIGDKVPESDVHWQLFLILLKICGVVLAPSFTHDTVAYLEVIIEEYLCTFREVYPHKALRPKQHYMTHYPSQIRRFGPLVHSWTMRQESKLSFAKKASRYSNYKNVPKTIARRHQFWMCHQIQSNLCKLTSCLEVSPKQSSVTLLCEDDYIQKELKRLIPCLSPNVTVCHPVWAKLQSSRFYKGLYVLIKFDVMNPLFGKIIDLVVVDETLIICVSHFLGESFYPHYNAFSIKAKGVVSAIDVFSLPDHRPFYARTTFSSCKTLYITLPYNC